MKISTVILDMDGTITDTEKYYNRTWPIAFAECGYPGVTSADALAQRSLNHVDAQLYWGARFGSDFDFEKVHRANAKLVAALMEQEGIEAKPGVKELLAYLKDAGIKTAVATATNLERALPRLERIGLADAFDAITSVSMVKRGKPHPDVYLYACKELGVDPAQCVAIEDSPNGIRSAQGAGCITIMVPDLTQPTEDLLPLLYGAADDLSEVIPLIQKLNA